MTTASSVKFRPVDNKILVKKIDAGQYTSSGIFVGKVEGVDKAEVVAVGGRVINCSVGDVLLVDWTKAIEIKLSGDPYYIIIDSLIVGIFEEGYEEPRIQKIS